MALPPRIRREQTTVEAMIRLYCRHHHGGGGKKPCDECTGLLDYARARLARCPFQEGKTPCGHCPVHCYKPALRERVRTVMRWAGPRMLLHHPGMALRHLWDSLRKEPVRPPP